MLVVFGIEALSNWYPYESDRGFYDINDNMDLAEDMLKYLVKYALENCKDDVEFLNNMYDKELIARLQSVVQNAFKRLTYTDAVENFIASLNPAFTDLLRR